MSKKIYDFGFEDAFSDNEEGEIEDPVALIEGYFFKYPSTREFDTLVAKFGINYFYDPDSAWYCIFVRVIPYKAASIEVLGSCASEDIVVPLTFLLTGDIEMYTPQVTQHLKAAYVNRLVGTGIPKDSAVDQWDDDRSKLSYLQFMAEFLGCRIGIYNGKCLEKFGEAWNIEDRKAVTLLFSHDPDNGLFDIVTDVK